ncbi:MAG: dihydropteroate synthase [Flavobacteriales bacterium]|nr:dihydropteroate synthase [Flavobacteriales bacterium]
MSTTEIRRCRNPGKLRHARFPMVEALHLRFPEALLSIDTYRSRVAYDAVMAGASLVSDIGAGLLDDPGCWRQWLGFTFRTSPCTCKGNPRTMQADRATPMRWLK